MSWTEILLLVFAVVTAVSWATLYARSKSLWKNLLELRDKYNASVADGTISDAEKAVIADELVEIVNDAMTIWQLLENLVRKLISVFRRR